MFTDGNGAAEAMEFAAYFDAQVMVMGNAVNNVSNNFLSYTETTDTEITEPGDEVSIVCASSLTNYGEEEVSLEVSLYDGKDLREIRQVTLEAGETTLIFFAPFVWHGEPLRSEIGSVCFAGTQAGDSLVGDNIAYAVAEKTGRIQAVMIGEHLYREGISGGHGNQPD